MSSASPSAPSSRTKIRARRVRFALPSGTQRQHFVADDLVMSHFIAVLSATFPEGEDFFIRSVRNFSSQVSDPELRQAVKGFIAQEATHRHHHRLLNERLQAMGYPTMSVERHIAKLITVLEKRFSEKMRLAVTAAFEHYTATLAEIILTSEDVQKLIGDTEVRPILLWHAFEESEHKAVAFDVYRAVGGTERMRVRAMRLASLIFLTEVVLQTARSLAGDHTSYQPLRLIRSLIDLRTSPMFTAEALRRFRSYNRPGFHPNDWDSTAVLEHWASELFNEDEPARVGSGQ